MPRRDRIVVDGRISIPSILTHKDGSKQEVMCYVVLLGDDEGSDILTVMTPRY